MRRRKQEEERSVQGKSIILQGERWSLKERRWAVLH